MKPKSYCTRLDKAPKLDHIPAVGFSSQLMSFIGAVEFLFNAPGIVQRGYNQVSLRVQEPPFLVLNANSVWQHRHSIFKLPNFSRWTVVVTGSKFIDELRKAPEDVLSFAEATDEVMLSGRLGNWTFNSSYRHSKLDIPLAQGSAKTHTIFLSSDPSSQVIWLPRVLLYRMKLQLLVATSSP
jgi:hypothetical protein